MIDTSRRALLAAIPAAAVAVSLPAAAMAATTPADRRAWEHAIARFVAARQASDDYDERIFNPAYDREVAYRRAHGLGCSSIGNPDTVPDDVNDEHDRLIDVMCAAEEVVLATPAPDLAALRWKLDKLFVLDHSGFDPAGSTPCWSAPYVHQTMLDIVRLLPEGR